MAAIYDGVFGWRAPYGYTSLPVLLGTAGGLGLLVGLAGLFALTRRRDPDLAEVAQKGLDEAFIALLFVTSLTGLALLVLRNEAAMGALLIVHGIYRAAALVKYASERRTKSG